MLVYSISSRVSFEKLKLINEKLLNMLGTEPPRVLVGSMSDLQNARLVLSKRKEEKNSNSNSCRQVSVEEGEELASKWKCPFIECSAKQNKHISTSILCMNSRLTPRVVEVFSTLIKEIEKDSGLLATDDNSTCVIL